MHTFYVNAAAEFEELQEEQLVDDCRGHYSDQTDTTDRERQVRQRT